MNPDSEAQKLRSRVLIAVAIVCGSLAAGLMWQSNHPKAPFGVTDEQARSAGFTSAAEVRSLSENDAKLYRDGGRREGWDKADFDIFQDAINSGNDKVRGTLEMKAAFIDLPDQRLEAVRILGNRRLLPPDKLIWAFVIRNWLQIMKPKSNSSDLVAAGNADIAAITSAELNNHDGLATTAQ